MHMVHETRESLFIGEDEGEGEGDSKQNKSTSLHKYLHEGLYEHCRNAAYRCQPWTKEINYT